MTVSEHPREHRVELELGTAESLELLSQEAESWGGAWQRDGMGGRLVLPVVAGLRRGLLEGTVTAEPAGSGCRLTFRVEKSSYRLQKLAVAVLALAALGALTLLAAPLVPRLWPAVPLGFLLTVAAWLFIVASLGNSGPEELFESLAREAGEGGGE